MVLFIRYMGKYRKPKHVENVKKVVFEELTDVMLDEFTGDDSYTYHPIDARITYHNGEVSHEYDICDIELM